MKIKELDILKVRVIAEKLAKEVKDETLVTDLVEKITKELDPIKAVSNKNINKVLDEIMNIKHKKPESLLKQKQEKVIALLDPICYELGAKMNYTINLENGHETMIIKYDGKTVERNCRWNSIEQNIKVFILTISQIMENKI